MRLRDEQMKTAIVCVADNLGVMFNHRRVSRDAAVTADILRLAQNAPLYLSPYSLPLFAQSPANIVCVNDFSGALPENAVCFFEDILPRPRMFDRLVLYRWNRDYPADTFFSVFPGEEGFALLARTDFSGVSHPVVTREIYEKETAH